MYALGTFESHSMVPVSIRASIAESNLQAFYQRLHYVDSILLVIPNFNLYPLSTGNFASASIDQHAFISPGKSELHRHHEEDIPADLVLLLTVK